MSRTPHFRYLVISDTRHMFHVSHSSCFFSMFPLRALCFTTSLFSDSTVSLHLILLSSRLCLSDPSAPRTVSSEPLVYIFLTLVPSSLRTNITYSPLVPPEVPLNARIPTRLRPSSSPLFVSRFPDTRSGADS